MEEGQELINIQQDSSLQSQQEKETKKILNPLKILPSISDLQLFQGSSHPIACFFHLFFKILILFIYLFLSYFLGKLLSFISITILSSFDFWTMQNVTGRLLVGLRWKNQVNEDGTETWVFEGIKDDSNINPIDRNVFWAALFIMPAIWGFFLFVNVISANIFWALVDLVTLTIAMTNAIGYIKCLRGKIQCRLEIEAQGFCWGKGYGYCKEQSLINASTF